MARFPAFLSTVLAIVALSGCPKPYEWNGVRLGASEAALRAKYADLEEVAADDKRNVAKGLALAGVKEARQGKLLRRQPEENGPTELYVVRKGRLEMVLVTEKATTYAATRKELGARYGPPTTNTSALGNSATIWQGSGQGMVGLMKFGDEQVRIIKRDTHDFSTLILVAVLALLAAGSAAVYRYRSMVRAFRVRVATVETAEQVTALRSLSRASTTGAIVFAVTYIGAAGITVAGAVFDHVSFVATIAILVSGAAGRKTSLAIAANTTEIQRIPVGNETLRPSWEEALRGLKT